MTVDAPWLVRTEQHARRLGSSVSIESLAIPSSDGIDARALGEWHLRMLSDRHDDLSVGELEEFSLGTGTALMRYGSLATPGAGHLVAIYREVRGTIQALVAHGPRSAPAAELSRNLLEWIEQAASVELSIEEFRAIESVRGAAPAAFVPRSALIEQDAASPSGAVEAIARSLALRGVLESTGEGTWTLSGDAGAIVAPLIGSRHVAWLTWTDAAGAHGAAALGRVETAWSLLREDRGALRVTALDAVSPGETAAALGGVTSAGRPGDGPVVHAAATELRPGCAVAGLGTIAAAAAVRFVRPAGSGLEQSEITWLHDAEGGLWEVTADGTAALCASPVTSASLIARVTEGFESEDTQP